MAWYSTYGLPILLLNLIVGCSGAHLSSDTYKMTKEELATQMAVAHGDTLLILDVRLENQWMKSDYKIKGAVRENPSEFKSWADKYPKDKILVLYCA